MRFAIVAFLLAACGSSSTDTAERAPESRAPEIAVPEVAGNGYSAMPAESVAVVITKTGLVVEGQPIVKIADGKVDPSELEGGAMGIKIVKLANYAAAFARQWSSEHGTEPTFALRIDPALPYRLLISTMFSIKSAPAKRFAIIARSSGRLVALPIALPEKRPPSDRGYATALTNGGDPRVSGRRPGADLGKQIEDVKNSGTRVEVKPPTPTHGDVAISEDDARALADQLTSSPADDKVAVMMPPPDDDRPIGLFVSIAKEGMLVWSVSRLEGTLREPKARIKLGATAMNELSKVLTEIVQRRWGQPGHPRAADTKTIVIQADGTTPMQVVAEVMGAVRAGPDGRELFPDIQLSSGFE